MEKWFKQYKLGHIRQIANYTLETSFLKNYKIEDRQTDRVVQSKDFHNKWFFGRFFKGKYYQTSFQTNIHDEYSYKFLNDYCQMSLTVGWIELNGWIDWNIEQDCLLPQKLITKTKQLTETYICVCNLTYCSNTCLW